MRDLDGNRWYVLVAASLGLFLVVVDSTIVNISIPAMIAGLNTDLTHVEWVLNGYTLVFAALLIPAGRLGDMYGRKLVFSIGLALFGLFSAACGLAPSIGWLITARVFQAVGAAAMMPATLSLIRVNFRPSQLGIAFGIWAAISGFGIGIGPTLGGLLTQYDWRYIFYVNVPIVIAALWFTWVVVPESLDEGEHVVDWLGAALWIATLTAFNYAVIEGPGYEWSAPILGLFVVSAVLLALFVWWEGKPAEPMMELALFRSMPFSAGNAAMATLLFGMVGSFFLIPLFLQDGLGYSALKTGLALAPIALVLMTVGPLAGNLSDRIEPRLLVGIGMAIVGVALLWVSAFTVSASQGLLLPRFILLGVGAGLAISPMTSAVMRTVPADYAGSASGMLSTSQRLGAVLGVAILGAVLQVSMSSALTTGLQGVPGVSHQAAQQIVQADKSSRLGLVGGESSLQSALASSGLDGATLATLQPRVLPLARDAFAHAIQFTLRLAAGLVLLAAALTFAIKPSDESEGTEAAGNAGVA